MPKGRESVDLGQRMTSSTDVPFAYAAILRLAVVLVAGVGGGCSDPDETSNDRTAQIQDGVVIDIKAGVVRGQLLDGVRTWRGLPYAATPTGTRRFRPPQPHPGWSEPLHALAHGRACAQASSFTDAFDPTSGEDCLYLSVASPAAAPKSPLPVMVWIHGGAFVTGHGGEVKTDPAKLVAHHNVVVVRINYRLGVSGFVHLPQLLANDGDEAASADNASIGNVGLRDQVAALQWVQANIRAFGGDPNNVTVFGQSSGGLSVCALLTSPLSGGLFHRAIIQSGSCHVRLPSAAAAKKQSEALLDTVGCATATNPLSCLRSKPIEDLVSAAIPGEKLPGGLFFGTVSQRVWTPFVDGDFLLQQPSWLMDQSNVHDVQVIVGSNKDDGRLFQLGLLGGAAVKTDKEYLQAIGRRFGIKAHDIVAKYPPSKFGGHDLALAEVATDAFFTCPARRTAKALGAYAAVYRYHFEFPPMGSVGGGLGVLHGAEVPYVFGNGADGEVAAMSADEAKVSALMQRYWVRFAKTGDPNSSVGAVDSDPLWPKSDGKDALLRIKAAVESGSELKAEICDFWDKIPFHVEVP